MERTARALAGYGRHGDNNLLHVSDQELRGIELLSGKKFTRNPDTGLPEAFNWSSLIPVAAGIAGTVLSGGNPLVGAAAAGATSAGKAKIEGKSTEQALTQGLISGVTSYAGGQIFAGAPTAASEAAGEGFGQVAAEGANVAAPSVASMSPEAAMASLPSTPTEFTTGVSGLGTGTPAVPAGPIGSAQIYGGAGSVGPTAPSFTQGISNTATNLANNPSAALEKVGENISNNKMSALIAAGGAYTTAMDAIGPPKMPGEEPYDPSKYPEQFPANPRTWNAPGAGYRAGYSPEYQYFAKGGLADLRKEDGVTANAMNEAKAALLGEHPRPSEALGRFRNMFGEDALDVLRDKVTGGRVRGAGGGMDDLVPGTIEGRQQVRLADGEFVLPAHIVSAIGDGSTDHGVRRLKEMMDSIYRQKYKSDSLPKRLKKGTLVDE
jgi:hypothetical protein